MAPTIPLATACGRLATLCQILARVDGNNSIAVAWAQALRVKPTSTLALMQGLQAVSVLAASARREVMAMAPGHRELVLASWAHVDALLEVRHWDQQWSAKSAHVAPPLPDLLLTVHHNLNGETETRRATVLQRLRQRLEEVLSDVTASPDIDAHLRTLLSTMLKQGLAAITQYELFGLDALQHEMPTAATTVLRHADALRQHAEQPLVRRSLSVLKHLEHVSRWANANQGAVALYLGVASIITTLAVAAIPLLPKSEPASPPPALPAPAEPLRIGPGETVAT